MSQQDNSTFYQKAFVAGLISFGGRRTEYSDQDGDAALLRLHECLAIISVAKATREVIACHIAPGSGSSTLHMGRNDAWTSEQKNHVQRVRDLLAQMAQAKTPSEVDALKTKLKDSIFEYCEEKVQKRIGKFLWTADYVLTNDLSQAIEELFPHDKDDPEMLKKLAAVVEVIKADLKELKALLVADSNSTSLDDKSKKCKEVANNWESNTGQYKEVLVVVREKFPSIEKRMLKVASYDRSVDVLSDWATGGGDYSQSYPVPDETISYSTPDIRPSSELIGQYGSWDTIAKAFYPEDATDQHITSFKTFNPPLSNNPKPSKNFYLHAEMHIVQDLLNQAPSTNQGDRYIGISKLCCYLCYHCISTVNSSSATSGLHILVKGTHNKFYNTWLIPSSFSGDQLTTLEKTVDALNVQALNVPKEVPGGSDESAPVTLDLEN